MSELKQRVVLYHGGCRDGFGAAWAAHCYFGSDADYVPQTYARPLPEFQPNSDIWFLDWCPRAPDLVRLLDEKHRVHILDHHLTTDQVIDSVQSPNLEIVYDVEHSGAVIAWEYFHPKRKVPKLLCYIEDRDLWRWMLEGTEAVTEALTALEWSFDLFDRLNRFSSELNQLEKAGHLLVAAKHKQVKEIVKRAYFTEIGGYRVPVVNSDSYVSNVGAALAEAHRGVAFAGVWFRMQDGRYKWSLRSINDDTDLSQVAKSYGGGGHLRAAGFITKEALHEPPQG